MFINNDVKITSRVESVKCATVHAVFSYSTSSWTLLMPAVLSLSPGQKVQPQSIGVINNCSAGSCGNLPVGISHALGPKLLDGVLCCLTMRICRT